MRCTLVTGGNGFIGKHLMGALKQQGVNNLATITRKPRDENHWAFYGDLADEDFVRRTLVATQPHTIYHLAANPIVRADEEHPTDISKTNILATHNLLAHAPKGCRFVFASSATVYGNRATDQHMACHESMATTPNSIYGATKAASESLVRAYSALGLVRGISLRLVANVGLGSTHGLLHDVIRKLRSEDEELNLLGDQPGSLKPYIHVSDTVRALMLAGTHADWLNAACLNISVEGELAVETVAKLAMEVLNIHKPVRWLGEGANWRGDNRQVLVCTNEARRLSFCPKYNNSAAAVTQALQELKDCQ